MALNGKIIPLNHLEQQDIPEEDDLYLEDMTDDEIREGIAALSGKDTEAPGKETVEGRITPYLEAEADFPVYNHIEGVGPENIGYAQGILPDGMPFEAELWENGENGRSMSFLLPVLDLSSHRNTDPEGNPEKVDDLDPERESYLELPGEPERDCGVLAIGMAENGTEDDETIVFQYAEYLEEAGIFRYTGELRKRFVEYMTDPRGNLLAHVIITLSEDGRTEAEADLRFRPFFGAYRPWRVSG